MIRVHKPQKPPKILEERGRQMTQVACERVDSGVEPDFDRSVFGASEVKEALRVAQHDKCCFCESKIGHAQFGDVEHFRPKATVRQSADSPASRPGYYWLAYDWDNLYLACAVCNRRHKHGYFPLADPATRVSRHDQAHALVDEQPLFIDPGKDDPAVFIEFRCEVAVPVEADPRGVATVNALALNRPALAELRRERRDMLVALLRILFAYLRAGSAAASDDELRLVVENLISWASDSSAYAAMTRALLQNVTSRPRAWELPARELLDELVMRSSEGGSRTSLIR